MRHRRVGATGVAALAVLLAAITGKSLYNLFPIVSRLLKYPNGIYQSNDFDKLSIIISRCTHCHVYLCGYHSDIKTGSAADVGILCEIILMIHPICRLCFE